MNQIETRFRRICRCRRSDGIYSFHLQKQTKLRGENESLNQQIAQMQERDDAKIQLAAAQREIKNCRTKQSDEFLRLRGETGVLRRQLDEAPKKIARCRPQLMADSNTNSPMPQIHIKARFLTMPKDVSAGWYDSTSAGILTSENFSIVLKQLRSRNDVETLAEPEVMTNQRTPSSNAGNTDYFCRDQFLPSRNKWHFQHCSSN